MKNKYKILIGLFIGFFVISCFSNNVKGVSISDLFVNTQNDNSTITINYGSIIEYATESNNYRNYLDINTKGISFNFDNMVSLANTIDYSSYLYQQQKYFFNNDTYVLSDGNFSGTYTFDDDVGSNPSGWILYGTPTGNVLSNYNSHHSVLGVSSNSGYEGYYQIISSLDFGTIEFYVQLKETNIRHRIELSDGNLAAHGFNIDFYSDSYLKANIAGGGYTNIIQYSANTWYHIRIDFTHISNGYVGLTSNKYTVYVNGAQYGIYSYITNIPITHIGLYANSGGTMYIDGLGYTWSEYYVGNNINSGYYDLDYLDLQLDDLNLINSYSISPLIDHRGMCYYNTMFYVLCSDGSNLYEYHYDVNFNYIGNTLLGTIASVYKTNGIFFDSFGVMYWSYIDGSNYHTYIKKFGGYSLDAGINALMPTIKDDIIYYYNTNKYYMYDLYFNFLGNIEGNTPLVSFVWCSENNVFYGCLYNYLYVLDENFNFITYYSIDNDYYGITYYNGYIYMFESTGIPKSVKQYFIKDIYILKSSNFIVYCYSSSSVLTGKIEVGFERINYYTHSVKVYIRNYYYSGLFILTFEHFLNINMYDLNELEIQIHVCIMYENVFKKTGVKIVGIVGNNTYEYSYEHLFDYNSNYPFDKFLLTSFVYSQSNTGVYLTNQDIMLGVNTNFFKNDLYGFRTLFCVDLNQKFVSFYDFGNFNDTIDIGSYIIPNDITTYDVNWKYTGFTIDFDSNTTISTIHFSFDFPIVSVNSITMYHRFNTLHYSSKAWYDVFKNVMIFVLNQLWTFLNLLLFYCIILPFNYVIIYVFLCLVLVLVWNILLFGLVYAGLWFLEGLYLLLFDLLPVLWNFLTTTLIPIILDGIATLTGYVVGYIIWIFSGTLLDLPTLINAITNLTNVLLDFVYQLVLYFLENLIYILMFSVIYIAILWMLYFKYLLSKTRGFVNLNVQLLMVIKIWSYPIEVIAKSSDTLSRLIPKVI